MASFYDSNSDISDIEPDYSVDISQNYCENGRLVREHLKPYQYEPEKRVSATASTGSSTLENEYVPGDIDRIGHTEW
jgi:hypothetical protein